MGFSFNGAIAALTDPANAAKYSTLDGLMELVTQTSIDVPGAKPNAITLLYSGKISTSESSPGSQAIAEFIARSSDGSVRITTTTDTEGNTTATRDNNGDGRVDEIETNVTAADGSNMDDLRIYDDSGALVEDDLTLVHADGSSIEYDTEYGANGSYQQSWTASDGSHGENDLGTDGGTLTNTTQADGSSVTTTFDASTGVHGYDVVHADGSEIDYNTTYGANGSYLMQSSFPRVRVPLTKSSVGIPQYRRRRSESKSRAPK